MRDFSWRSMYLRRMILSIVVLLLTATVCQAAPHRVLFFSKSSGFEHPVIKRTDGQPSHVERILQVLADESGFELVASKDGTLISADHLADFDAVIFYTTGDLNQAGAGSGLFGRDGELAIPEDGIAALREWVEAGGGFMGFHSATDTFRNPDGPPTPYVELLGGEFLSHGRQFEGRVEVVDLAHPTMKSVPVEWVVQDEWYVFRNLDAENMHVLALLDTASDPHEQALYDRPAYPIIWCKAVGAGRVFYNGMGHREDVWSNPVFQEAFLDALNWSLGSSEVSASPNFAGVVPNQ